MQCTRRGSIKQSQEFKNLCHVFSNGKTIFLFSFPTMWNSLRYKSFPFLGSAYFAENEINNVETWEYRLQCNSLNMSI